MSTMQEERVSGPVLPPGRVRRSFPREFKADAVALVLDEGRSIASVARSLGIGATSLAVDAGSPTAPARLIDHTRIGPVTCGSGDRPGPDRARPDRTAGRLSVGLRGSSPLASRTGRPTGPYSD